MGLFSNQVKKRYLKPGDHIYSYRGGWTYSHHGIYKGENGVVHFTSAGSAASSRPRASNGSTCSACDLFEHRERASGVVISCLDCFRGRGSLYRYEYGVSGGAYSVRRRGTCNTAESGPVEVVMQRALHLLENGFGDYQLLTNNCEDFATYCKTGQKCNRNGTTGRYGQASIFCLGFASRNRDSHRP